MKAFVVLIVVALLLSGCTSIESPSIQPVVSAEYSEASEKCPGYGVMNQEEIYKRCDIGGIIG